MFERFTGQARDVVDAAQREAQRLGQNEVGAEHLLLGLMDGRGIGSEVLHDAGLAAEPVRAAIRRHSPVGEYLSADDAQALRFVGIDLDVVLERLVASFGPDVVAGSRPRPRRLRFSRAAKRSLQLAVREAVWLKERSIGSEHLLLGLLRGADERLVAVLIEFGVTPDELRAATLRQTGRAA